MNDPHANSPDNALSSPVEEFDKLLTALQAAVPGTLIIEEPRAAPTEAVQRVAPLAVLNVPPVQYNIYINVKMTKWRCRPQHVVGAASTR